MNWVETKKQKGIQVKKAVVPFLMLISINLKAEDFDQRITRVYQQSTLPTPEIVIGDTIGLATASVAGIIVSKQQKIKIQTVSQELLAANNLKTVEDLDEEIKKIRLNHNNYEQIVLDEKGARHNIRLEMKPEIIEKIHQLQANAAMYETSPFIPASAKEPLKLSVQETIQELVIDKSNYLDRRGQARDGSRILYAQLSKESLQVINEINERKAMAITAEVKAKRISILTKKLASIVKPTFKVTGLKVVVRSAQVFFVVDIGARIYVITALDKTTEIAERN